MRALRAKIGAKKKMLKKLFDIVASCAGALGF